MVTAEAIFNETKYRPTVTSKIEIKTSTEISGIRNAEVNECAFLKFSTHLSRSYLLLMTTTLKKLSEILGY